MGRSPWHSTAEAGRISSYATCSPRTVCIAWRNALRSRPESRSLKCLTHMTRSSEVRSGADRSARPEVVAGHGGLDPVEALAGGDVEGFAVVAAELDVGRVFGDGDAARILPSGERTIRAGLPSEPAAATIRPSVVTVMPSIPRPAPKSWMTRALADLAGARLDRPRSDARRWRRCRRRRASSRRERGPGRWV